MWTAMVLEQVLNSLPDHALGQVKLPNTAREIEDAQFKEAYQALQTDIRIGRGNESAILQLFQPSRWQKYSPLL